MSAKYTFAVYSTIVGSAKEKLVLLKLADNANDNGVCWPAMGYLQKHTELSRSSLLRSLKSLEEKGFIRVTRRKTEDKKQNLSNVYQLTLPSVTMELPQYQDETTPSVIMTPKSNNIESKKESKKEQEVFLDHITNHWNEIMTTQPKINLLDKTKATKTRIAAIKKITNDYPNYLDHEYWQGYFYRLSTLKHFEWHRENVQVKFDQATNYKKFTDNVELMRMEEA